MDGVVKMFFFLGRIVCCIFPCMINDFYRRIGHIVRTGYYKSLFFQLYSDCRIMNHPFISGAKMIKVDHHVVIGRYCTITAALSNKYISQIKIHIGENCMFGDFNHITAVNNIIFGKGVRTGSNVLITDNSHGHTDGRFPAEFDMKPNDKPIVSSGPVIIGNNVWIGDKVSILPDVRIGDGVVIGANSVVTHNIPSYCIVAGSPAKIVRRIKAL